MAYTTYTIGRVSVLQAIFPSSSPFNDIAKMFAGVAVASHRKNTPLLNHTI